MAAIQKKIDFFQFLSPSHPFLIKHLAFLSPPRPRNFLRRSKKLQKCEKIRLSKLEFFSQKNSITSHFDFVW